MVLTKSDSSAILVEPMKNRSSGEMVRAYQSLISRLNSTGISPKAHILDNECSSDFKAIIKTNKMSYQLVPPHDHRRNRSEKAIQTFKAHFIAILCGTDHSFPLHLWDRHLVQAEHTLNMLLPARMLKTVSAHTYLWGQHDYNSQPYAPLGCKVEAHVVPKVRETWASHTATGYYIGNADEHYRCHTVYITNTKSTRTCSSVFFKHKYLTMPTLTPADALIKAADDLTAAIAGNIPPSTITDNAITQLLQVFKQQANSTNDAVSAQRVLTNRAQRQRVLNEEETASTPTIPTTIPTAVPTTNMEFPPLVIKETITTANTTPASNTRHQQRLRTITQDCVFHLPEATAQFTPQLAANIPSNF
jgi:hypothetical protein